MDVAVLEQPVQSTTQTSFIWGKKGHIPDPEVVSVQDDDSEFMLPRIGSLVVVILTNVLLQVSFGFLLNPLGLLTFATPDHLFHHRSIIGPVRRTSGRRADILRSCRGYPGRQLRLGSFAFDEVRRRYGIHSSIARVQI